MFDGQSPISLHFNEQDVNNDCNKTYSDHKVQQRLKSTVSQTLITVQQKFKNTSEFKNKLYTIILSPYIYIYYKRNYNQFSSRNNVILLIMIGILAIHLRILD